MDGKITKKQNFQDLYGYFCGMLTRGDMDEIYGQILGAIPDLGTVKGSITLLNPSGTNTSDNIFG